MADYWAELPRRIITTDDNGGTGIRVFEGIYPSSSATISGASGVVLMTLPSRGSGYPGASSRLKLSRIVRRLISTSGQWEAELTYTPPTFGEWTTSGESFANLPRSFSIGGELIQFANSGDYYYVNAGTDNDPITGDVPAFRKVVTSQLTIQEVVSDISSARTRAKAAVNRTNNVVFEGFAAGDLLYAGFESEEFTNDDGDLRWRLRHQFIGREIPGTSNNGWEYVLRDDTAEWTYIQISPAADEPLPIYQSAAFASIFGTS